MIRPVARDQVRGFAAAIARAAARAVPAERLPDELADTIAEVERAASATREHQSYIEWLHSPEHARLIPGRSRRRVRDRRHR